MEEVKSEVVTRKRSLRGHGVKVLILFLFISLVAVSFALVKEREVKITKYDLIDSSIADLEIGEFLEKREKYKSYYSPLKEKIEEIINDNLDITIGVYFEDLTSRAWVGIKEREKFIPASLLKTTTAAAVLKMVEEGEIDIEGEVEIGNDDLNKRFGNLYQHAGELYTVEELVEISLRDSDNTATNVLREMVPIEKMIEARLALGLPIDSVLIKNTGTLLSPREFSNVFKSLYLSGYLSRESSNYLLLVMSKGNLSYGLKEGVPEDIIVSHKIGIYSEPKSIHDCGIIYSDSPYILCVMTKESSDSEKAKMIIEKISRTVYNFVNV